jgi:hypothetical protein
MARKASRANKGRVMGYANAELISACESARSIIKRLSKLIDDSQAECWHPEEDRRVVHSPPAKPEHHGRLMCMRCSKLLPP